MVFTGHSEPVSSPPALARRPDATLGWCCCPHRSTVGSGCRLKGHRSRCQSLRHLRGASILELGCGVGRIMHPLRFIEGAERVQADIETLNLELEDASYGLTPLDDQEVEKSLRASGLQIDRWFDDRRTWFIEPYEWYNPAPFPRLPGYVEELPFSEWRLQQWKKYDRRGDEKPEWLHKGGHLRSSDEHHPDQRERPPAGVATDDAIDSVDLIPMKNDKEKIP